MTTPQQLASSFLGLITLVLALIVFYQGWQGLVVDWAKDEIGRLRDVWFDTTVWIPGARQLKAVRCVQAYCEVMAMQVEHTTWPVTTAIYLAAGAWSRAQWASLTAQIDSIENDEMRELARATVKGVTRTLLIQLLCRSIFVFPIGILLAFGQKRWAKNSKLERATRMLERVVVACWPSSALG